MANRSPIPLTLEVEWGTYHVAMRDWQHQMFDHFGGMPPPKEMGPYLAWCPSPVRPVRGQPGSFDASLAATPGIATPQTAGSTPLGGPTSRDSPRVVVRHDVQRRRHLSMDSTAGSLALPPPHTRPRTGSTPHLSSPASTSASSSQVSPALSQTRSSLRTSARASTASQTSSGRGCGRGRRGCCGGGDDDVDGSAHIVATNNDRVGWETPVGRLYYTLDNAGVS
jgi:hypothetical protein